MSFLEGLDNFKLYLIEPIERYFDQLYNVYGKFGDKVTYLNYAISNDTSGNAHMIDLGVMSYVDKMPEEWKKGDKLFSETGESLSVVEVKSKTWQDFVTENKIDRIDILLLDCEGHELNIISQMDFEKTRIKSIRYEYETLKKVSENQSSIDPSYKTRLDKVLDCILVECGYSISLDQTDPTFNKVALTNV
jgi:FkbM family methyltransferase